MNERGIEPGTIRNELTLYEVLVSIGIPLALHSEDLFNEVERARPDKLLDISEQLHLLSHILGIVITKHEVSLRKVVVQLGDDIIAVSVHNPLYVAPDQRRHPF